MDELVRLAGGRNAAARFSGRYPRLSVEELVAARPDVIFVAGMAGVERFPPEVTRWKEIPAFRDGAVITLDGDLVTRPGPAAGDRARAGIRGSRRVAGEPPEGARGGRGGKR